MAVVTVTNAFGVLVSYFDGIDQLIPFCGFSVSGTHPTQPKNFQFEIPVPVLGSPAEYSEACSALARRLFCSFGYTADQVIKLMEDF